MTDPDQAGDGEQVLTLQQLIRARMADRGWTYRDLERQSGGRLTDGRWQQLGSGYQRRSGESDKPQRFPLERDSIIAVAETLDVTITTVILSAAASLELDVRRTGPDLAHLLPAGTDLLRPEMRDAILALIRAAVGEALLLQTDGDDDPALNGPDATLEWRKIDAPSGKRHAGRNAEGRSVDTD